MAILKTKFSIGDRVYWATTTTEKKQHACPDCLGKKIWEAISPAGEKYTFSCPRCSAGFKANRATSLDYSIFAPKVIALTIGSVRTDTNDADDRVSYMCCETGVGSGQIYREKALFAIEQEALDAAKLNATEQNKSTPWVVKQYDSTFELSDYQLGSAAMKDAKKIRINAEVAMEMLLGEVENASSAEDVKQAVADWRRHLAA